MVTLPPHIKKARRAQQLREAKARQREKDKAEGMVEFVLRLPADAAVEIDRLRLAQAGPVDTFYARALVTGARFLYNAGNVRGGKVRVSRTRAACLPGTSGTEWASRRIRPRGSSGLDENAGVLRECVRVASQQRPREVSKKPGGI